jgi:hypothetical protein
MSRLGFTLAAAAFTFAGAALAQQAAPPAVPPSASEAATSEPKVCKFVVEAARGAKPYQLCMTKAEWDAKKLADAKDATRIECRYEEMPGTRFRSAKVCMPASQWAEQRRLDREAVERIQSGVCVAGAGC